MFTPEFNLVENGVVGFGLIPINIHLIQRGDGIITLSISEGEKIINVKLSHKDCQHLSGLLRGVK